MQNSRTLLTRGQASCLALSMYPTDDNRKIAKDILNASQFDVVYLQDYNPLIPVAIGKNAKRMNPFLYCSYPETPPPEQITYEEEVEQMTISGDNNTVVVDKEEISLAPVTSFEKPQASEAMEINQNQSTTQNDVSVVENPQRQPVAPRLVQISLPKSNRKKRGSSKKGQYQPVPKKATLTPQADIPLSRASRKSIAFKPVADPPLSRAVRKAASKQSNLLLTRSNRRTVKSIESPPAEADKEIILNRSNLSFPRPAKETAIETAEPLLPRAIKSKATKKKVTKAKVTKKKSIQSTEPASPTIIIEPIVEVIEPPLSNSAVSPREEVQLNAEYNSVNGPVASRNKVLNFLKKVLLVNKPESPHFELQFVTSALQHQIVKESLNVGPLNQQKLANLISRADIFSYCINYNGERGRWLYVMKKQYRDMHTIY